MAELDTKLGMSLDDLIAEQKKKTPSAKKPARRGPAKAGPRNPGRGNQPGGQQQQQQLQKTGGRQPGRGKNPPAGGPGIVNRVRGGVRKQQGAPKFTRPVLAGRTVPVGAQPRNMKIVINNANARVRTQPPPDFLAGSRSRGGGGGSGSAPMMLDEGYRPVRPSNTNGGMAAPPPGPTLSSRFDKLAGSSKPPAARGGVPAAARGSSGPRRNAHGVLIP